MDTELAEQTEQGRYTIEWAPFTLADGVTEATLLAASDALQRDFLSQQPGFVRRELIRGAGNQWVDLVFWESLAAAEEASRRAMSSDICHRYFALMVAADHSDPGAGVSHFAQVKTYV